MFSRFLTDYGIIFILLALCVVVSIVTMDEQHPTGGGAGRELAESIMSQTAKGDAIFIVARDLPEDQEFAATLTKDLSAQGRIVLGTFPRENLLETLKKIAGSQRVRGIAAVQAAGVGPILENAQKKYPTLAETELFLPRSYLWPNFLKPTNLLNITNQVAVIAIIAIGMTMVIITGGIDLSVGSLMALSAVVTAVLIRDFMGGYEASGAGMVSASLAALALCGLIGLVTGILVTRFQMPPFIATLGMMLIVRGLAFKFSDSQSIDQIPVAFTWLGLGADIAAIPNSVVLMLLLYIAAHIVMARTVLGRYIYAVGGNAEAARLSGVPVARIIVLVYVVTDIFAGLGGVIVASKLKSSNPNYGDLQELYVIAAVVVGGTSLSGGEGKIFGTLLGAFLIAVIQNGMNLTGVQNENQRIVLGLVILVAVLADKLKKKLSRGMG